MGNFDQGKFHTWDGRGMEESKTNYVEDKHIKYTGHFKNGKRHGEGTFGKQFFVCNKKREILKRKKEIHARVRRNLQEWAP